MPEHGIRCLKTSTSKDLNQKTKGAKSMFCPPFTCFFTIKLAFIQLTDPIKWDLFNILILIN